MNLDLAQPFSQRPLLLWSQVLVAEEDDAPLGDEQGELVLLRVGEVLELEALDLGADVRREVGHLGRGAEERLLGLVGAGARVGVGALRVADLVDIVQVERPRRAVGIAIAQVDAGLLEAEGRGFRKAQSVLDGLGVVDDLGDDGGWRHDERRYYK